VFFRGYDGVTSTDRSAPATVSSFRLDRDKVTVGRFRAFIGEVVTAGWRPAAGSGRHVHVGGGSGLTGSDGKSETGWDPAWNTQLPATLADWTQRLSCDPRNVYTWTETAGEKENRPITCVDWLAAYAFCIWDGAFLPTVTESTYAAAGGGSDTGQRLYPWSVPPTSGVIDCAHANYGDGDAGVCPPPGIHDVGKTSPAGDGAFGQSDLVGNTWDWQLDYAGGEFTTPCNDCLTTTPGDGGSASVRGVSFRFRANDLRVVAGYGMYSGVADDLGVRCARIP
jgi:formylglycine-generating enzyme required for sulfatase activity